MRKWTLDVTCFPSIRTKMFGGDERMIGSPLMAGVLRWTMMVRSLGVVGSFSLAMFGSVAPGSVVAQEMWTVVKTGDGGVTATIDGCVKNNSKDHEIQGFICLYSISNNRVRLMSGNPESIFAAIGGRASFTWHQLKGKKYGIVLVESNAPNHTCDPSPPGFDEEIDIAERLTGCAKGVISNPRRCQSTHEGSACGKR